MSGSGVRAGETGGRETANAPRPDTHEWLPRQLDKAAIGYVRHDYSLLAVDDLEAAATCASAVNAT